MLRKLDNRGGHYALLLATGACLFLINLGGASLWDLDEGRNATAAVEMLESADWLVPTFNGRLRVDKPALLYWLQAAAYQVFGINELAARLPSALAALLAVLLTYELGRRLFNPATGLIGGLAFATAPLVGESARFANPDALLNACSLATLLALWLAIEKPGRLRFAVVGACAGLGVLAKGPVGVVMPTAVNLAFVLWAGKGREIWRPRWIGMSALTFCLAALPWYILVGVETRFEFLRGFIMHHNVERFLTPMEQHPAIPFFYVAILIGGLVPWSVVMGLTVCYGFWSAFERMHPIFQGVWMRTRDEEDGTSPGSCIDRYRFLWCWIGVYLVFFSLSATQLPNYILPAIAPLAILTARYFDRWRRGVIEPPAWAMPMGLWFLVLVGIITGMGMGILGGAIPLPGMEGKVLRGLEGWAVLGVIPLLGALAGWWCLRAGRRTGLVVSLGVTAVLVVGPFLSWGGATMNGYKAPRSLVEQAGACRRDADIRVACFDVTHLPSLNFYCRRTLDMLGDADEDALQFLRYQLPVYLVTTESTWARLEGHVQGPHRIVGHAHDMYTNSEMLVVTNR